MKQITAREFQRNFYKVATESLAVMRRGKLWATFVLNDVQKNDVQIKTHVKKMTCKEKDDVQIDVQKIVPQESTVTVAISERPPCDLCFQNKTPINWKLGDKNVCAWCFSKMSVPEKNKCKPV